MIKYKHYFFSLLNMTETITPTISDRICKHMNEDHGEAIVLYAQFYGKISSIESAKMLSIDNEGMYLTIKNREETPLRIEFDHKLADAKDAHNTLLEMLKEAQKNQ